MSINCDRTNNYYAKYLQVIAFIYKLLNTNNELCAFDHEP